MKLPGHYIDPLTIGVLNSRRIDECGRSETFVSFGGEGRKSVTLFLGSKASPARPSDTRSLKMWELEW